MNYQMAIALLLLSIVIMTAEASKGCQALTQISDFFSGRATFELSINESTSLAFNYQTYNITLPRRYDRNNCPQYSFALAEAATSTELITYFDLLVLKTFQTSLVVNFIYQPGKWNKATYNYWVAFRSDINLGIQSFSASQFSGNNQGKYQITYSMRRAAVPNQAAALVFLSGMRFDDSKTTNGHRLSFFLDKQYVSNGQLIFSFSCNTTLVLSSLTFAFLVFDPHALPFASYGGTISSISLASTLYQDLKYIVIPRTSYALFGVSSIETSKAFSLSSNLLSNLTLQYGVNTWEQLPILEVTYVIFGQSPASICLKNIECQAAGQLFISGRSCVARCPDNSKPIMHSDGAVQCISCPRNMVFSNSTNKCVCPTGFAIQTDGSCMLQQASVTYSKASKSDSLQDSPSNGALKCLKIVRVKSNNKNLFVTIQAGSQVWLDPQSSDRSYIRLQFGGTQANSYYCGPNNEDNTQYTCLALFSAGIPTYIPITASCTLSSSGIPCSDDFAYNTAKSQ